MDYNEHFYFFVEEYLKFLKLPVNDHKDVKKDSFFSFYNRRSSKSASVCWTRRISTAKQMQLVLTVMFLLCTTVSTPSIFLVYPTSKSPVNWRHYFQTISDKNKQRHMVQVLTVLMGALSKHAPHEAPACRQVHSEMMAGILPSWKDSNFSMGQPQVPL